MRKIVILTLFILVTEANAQTKSALDSIFVLPDSISSFSIEAFYTSILEAHPIVKQTRLLNEVAKQEIRLARGSFDPKIGTMLVR